MPEPSKVNVLQKKGRNEGIFVGLIKNILCLRANSFEKYRKSYIKPPGAYLISDTQEWGLLERGAYSKDQMKRPQGHI